MLFCFSQVGACLILGGSSRRKKKHLKTRTETTQSNSRKTVDERKFSFFLIFGYLRRFSSHVIDVIKDGGRHRERKFSLELSNVDLSELFVSTPTQYFLTIFLSMIWVVGFWRIFRGQVMTKRFVGEGRDTCTTSSWIVSSVYVFLLYTLFLCFGLSLPASSEGKIISQTAQIRP